ncbi:hypothetical protein BCR35DRAFT_309352 [Leucosporidium creatinivorum]|uniref:Bacterial low temperature requirement A protein-domain-containing protein n=1 Tax=Leucosporidium creatinivorum TaxID=106004 RepID=A0A1Y2DIH3_9BASI|nr:hypothetical protein BCR35DRAFT_309352 [Leucosporidium creatinivorum]
MISSTEPEKGALLESTTEAGSVPDLTSRPSAATLPSPPSISTTSRPSPIAPTLFDVAHSNTRKDTFKKHVLEHHAPLSWRHLLQRPVVRQWVVDDVLVREKEVREASGFELFLDLVMVAVVSQFAETAGNEDSSWSLFKFGIFFWLAWSVWQDARQYVNVSGNHDVLQRCYIFVLACLLIGFSVNASAVQVNCDFDESEESTYDEGYGEPFLLPGGCWMDPGWLRSARGALAFFLVARLLRIGLLVLYGFWLPRFGKAHLIRAVSMTVGSCMWVILSGVNAPKAFLIVPIAATGIEVAAQYLSTPLLRLTYRASRSRGWKGTSSLLPALNLEHSLERSYLFLILVIGEMVSSSKYEGILNHAGLKPIFWRAVLAIFIAFSLLWLYQEQSASRTFSHAMRRHWFTSTTWQLLHFPLSAALILAAVSVSSFVKYGEAAQKRQWYFGGAMSAIFTSLFLLGILHKPLDRPRSALIPRPFRLLLRLAFAVLSALLPLINNISSVTTLGATSLALLILLVLEMVGQIGSVIDDVKARRAVMVDREEQSDEEKEIGGTKELLARALRVERMDGFEEVENELHPSEMGGYASGIDKSLGELTAMRIALSQRSAYVF